MPARRRAPRSKKPLDVDALWAIKRIGAPTLAPDGRYVCAPVTSYDMDKNEGVTELWLFPTGFGAKPAFAKPRKLTAGDKDSDPRWSPDGKWIAFTAKRKDDAEPQVYLIAPDGGEATRLTNLATGALALKWFPDSKRIAFVSWVWPDLATEAAQGKRMKERKEAKVKAHLTERPEYRFWDHWLTDGREPHVLVCDIATGRTHDVLARARISLQPWEPTSDHYDIAPDGREIALTIDPHSEPGMMNRCDIAVVSLASGRAKNLSSASGMSDEHPRYSPDGRYLAWHAYDTARAFNDQGHLRLYDRRTARLQRLMPQFDRGTHHVDWTPDSRALLFLADVPGFMIGTQVEREGIIRHGAKMISAVSEATVPKISVIVRKAYGAGLYAMAGPAFDPDCCIALPTASIAVMGPSAAINAVYYNQLQAISDDAERAARTEELRREYAEDIDILHLASELVIDAVIQPEDLRAELIRRFALAAGKHREWPAKRNPVTPV